MKRNLDAELNEKCSLGGEQTRFHSDKLGDFRRDVVKLPRTQSNLRPCCPSQKLIESELPSEIRPS